MSLLPDSQRYVYPEKRAISRLSYDLELTNSIQAKLVKISSKVAFKAS